MISQEIPTGHKDVIHDIQFDFNNKRYATCSSDRLVKVFSVSGEGSNYSASTSRLIANLTGHEGPVWMVAWSHPRYDSLLASCSADSTAIIWRQMNGDELSLSELENCPLSKGATPASVWKPVHVVGVHSCSVNAIEWAPAELGCLLATASSDGTVGITICDEGGVWRETIRLDDGEKQLSHPGGTMAVSFMPWIAHREKEESAAGLIIATGGCDKMVKVWRMSHNSGVMNWDIICECQAHSDWVRDVRFCPLVLPGRFVYLASCGQDRTVVIQRISLDDLLISKRGESLQLDAITVSKTKLDVGIWRLAWSVCGTMLAVTTSDNEVVVLKEGSHPSRPWITMPVA